MWLLWLLGCGGIPEEDCQTSYSQYQAPACYERGVAIEQCCAEWRWDDRSRGQCDVIRFRLPDHSEEWECGPGAWGGCGSEWAQVDDYCDDLAAE